METPIQGAVELVGDEFGEKTPVVFKRLHTYQPGQSWILMIYGPSKTGKTYFAGTAGARTLVLNNGDGVETLMAPMFALRYPDAKNMIITDIRETNAQSSAEAFDKTTDAIDYALKMFPDKFDTVVLDEATAFRKYAMNKATELNTESRTRGAARAKRTEEFVKPDIGDYGTE